MPKSIDSRETFGQAHGGIKVELQRYLTPSDIAKLLRVSAGKVAGWIRRAELGAVNVGDGVRPRYRISRESFDSFLADREVQPPVQSMRKMRQAACPKGGRLDPELGEKLLKLKQAVMVSGEYYRVWNGTILFY